MDNISALYHVDYGCHSKLISKWTSVSHEALIAYQYHQGIGCLLKLRRCSYVSKDIIRMVIRVLAG